MIPEIYILIFSCAVLFFILGILKESVVFTAFSMLFWIVIMANSIFIDIPYYAFDSTNKTFYTGHFEYTYYSISFVALAFIIMCVIWTILQYTDFSYWRKRRIR